MKLLNKKKDLIVLLTSMVALILLGIVCYLLYVNRSTDVQIIDTSKGVFKVRGDGKTSVFTGDSWKELYSVRRDTTYDTYNVEAQGLYFNEISQGGFYLPPLAMASLFFSVHDRARIRCVEQIRVRR